MGVVLCVDGLPLAFSAKELRGLAEGHVEVLRCWIVTGPGSDISLRFGYVEVPTDVDAEKLIAAITGQKINCQLCSVAREEMG